MTTKIAHQNHQINCTIEGNGEAVLFLHGWPTNARLWNSQVEAFKNGYKVITIDWLGFGTSDKPVAYHYTFAKMQEILDAVLSQILEKEERVNIVAHDIGGPPAILWAHQNPDRLQRLILLNTVIYPFSTALDQMSHLFFKIPLIREMIVSRFGLNCLMQSLTSSGIRQVQNSIKEILDSHENSNSRVKLKTILEPLHEGKQNEFHQLANKFATINGKKCLIIARQDPLCYKHIQKLSDDNPDVPAYIIEKCGHYIAIDKPAELNKILGNILTKK